MGVVAYTQVVLFAEMGARESPREETKAISLWALPSVRCLFLSVQLGSLRSGSERICPNSQKPGASYFLFSV